MYECKKGSSQKCVAENGIQLNMLGSNKLFCVSTLSYELDS